MISLSRMAGEVCRTLYTVLSRVLQASLWNTIITLVVGKGGHLLKVCSIHLQRQEGEGEESTKIWLCFTVPERCCGLGITCAGPPLWGVHFICDSACVAAPLKYPPYQNGKLTCSSPHWGSKFTVGFLCLCHVLGGTLICEMKFWTEQSNWPGTLKQKC